MSAVLLLCCKTLYSVAAAAQQQSHNKLVWTTTFRCVWTLHFASLLRVRECRCVRVCAFLCWKPTFVFAPLAAAAVSCPVCHTALHALPFVQTRYNSCPTATLGVPRTMRMLTYHMRVCCVLYDPCACVQVCAGLRICSCAGTTDLF